LGRPLVLFDLDGTLVDSFGDIAAGIRAAFAALGHEADDALTGLARRGVPLIDLYQAAFGAADTSRYDAFAQAYFAYYLPRCVTTTIPYPGVIDALAELRARRPRPALAVATTKRTETARRVLDGTGLLGYFDAVVGSDGLPPKPDPAILCAAAERIGADIGLGVMIGDTDKDVLAARAAGCASIAVSYGGFSAEELAALHPDRIVHAFADILEWI
jgi:phosphoglycolate phosphatase